MGLKNLPEKLDLKEMLTVRGVAILNLVKLPLLPN